MLFGWPLFVLFVHVADVIRLFAVSAVMVIRLVSIACVGFVLRVLCVSGLRSCLVDVSLR